MNKRNVFLTIVTTLVLSGCGEKLIPEKSRIRHAPTSQENTGIIVSNVTEAKLADMLDHYPEMKVRVVNRKYGLFEVHNVSESALRQQLGPKARIQRNRYMRLIADPAKNMRGLKKLRTALKAIPMPTEEAKIFLDSCLEYPPMAPLLQVNSEAPMDRFEISRLVLEKQTVKFNARGSRARDGAPLQFLWIVRPTNYSKMAVTTYLGDEIEVTPDTTGEFIIIAVAKDSRGVCEMAVEPLYVTSNPKFDPSNALSQEQIAKMDLTPFWQLNAVSAIDSWPLSTGEGVTIAIIDTGTDYNHTALTANIAVNLKEIPGNGIDDDENGYVDDVAGYDIGADDPYPFDDYGHGTHCAGIAASPLMGVARGARILPVKVTAGAGMDIASVAGGIVYAVQNGAQILSISLGFEEDSEELRAAVEYARQKGVLVVAAAGNGDARGIGLDNDTSPIYPANYDFENVIAVAATNVGNVLTTYSNYGARTVHIAGPGGDRNAPVISTYKQNPSERLLEFMTGTSMATPAVVGVAAQALAFRPDLTPAELRAHLMNSGTPSVSLTGKIKSGRIVNSLGILHALQSVTSQALD